MLFKQGASYFHLALDLKNYVTSPGCYICIFFSFCGRTCSIWNSWAKARWKLRAGLVSQPWQCLILNPLSEARDHSHSLTETMWGPYRAKPRWELWLLRFNPLIPLQSLILCSTECAPTFSPLLDPPATPVGVEKGQVGSGDMLGMKGMLFAFCRSL